MHRKIVYIYFILFSILFLTAAKYKWDTQEHLSVTWCLNNNVIGLRTYGLMTIGNYDSMDLWTYGNYGHMILCTNDSMNI